MKKRVVGLLVIIATFFSMFALVVTNREYIFSSEKYYSETSVNKMLDDNYKKAVEENSDKKLFKKVSELTAENVNLQNKNSTLQAENEELTSQLTEKEILINELNSQITALNLQIAELEKNNSEYEEEIENLTAKVSELETSKSENEILIEELTAKVDDLEQTKSLNVKIIADYVSQVETLTSEKNDLDKQVKLLQTQISQNETIIAEHEVTIAQLQSSIKTYEDYIAGLESESVVYAIFVVENEIFEIYKSTTNGLVILENEPSLPENCTLNGWKVNGELIDLSTYRLTCNTTFDADLLYGYSVDFMVENDSGEYVLHNSQTVSTGSTLTLPSEPSREGYTFVGWSLDGVNVVENIETTAVTSNTTYYAVFNQIYTVTFMVENDNGEYELHNSQTVSNGSTLTLPSEPSRDGYTFVGWSLDGVNVINNIETTAVTSNTTYYAVFNQIYTVTFMVDDEAVSVQQVFNGLASPPNVDLIVDSTMFLGWSLDGENVIDNIESYLIENDCSFSAIYVDCTSWSIRYNNTVVGTGYLSDYKFMFIMQNGWKLDIASFTIYKSAKEYYISTISMTSVLGRNLEIAGYTNYYNNSTTGTTFSEVFTVEFNASGELVYTLNIGGIALDGTLTNASQYSIVTYVYFYTLPVDNLFTNNIVSMSNCAKIVAYSHVSGDGSVITLESFDGCVDGSITSWYINPSDLTKKYSEYGSVVSNSLTKLGNVGEIVDLLDICNNNPIYTSNIIYVFAFYEQTS